MTQAAFVLISTKYGKERDVCKKLLDHKEVEDVHILYGQYDLLAKIVSDDMKGVDNFILTHIRANPNIEGTQSLIVVGSDD